MNDGRQGAIMILKTSRCQVQEFSESHIKIAVPLFTNEQVRAFLGGPIPADWAERQLERWATEESDSKYFAITMELTFRLLPTKVRGAR